METTIAVWFTVAGDLEEAVDQIGSALEYIDLGKFPTMSFSLGDEAITYDENGDEVFNGEY